VNIFDFDKDIYGERIRLFFLEHTRDEKRFRDLDLLRRRLIIDQIKVRKILDEENDKAQD
jgi:riboflavin kinase / FMN adenylyltransferase